jgi:hypothetical protein
MNTIHFEEEYQSAVTWGEQYRKMSKIYEYGAFIYSRIIDGQKVYYWGRTLRGMGWKKFHRPNVVLPFLYLYLFESIRELLTSKALVEAFIHTHPEPQKGYSCKEHSREDIWLLKLPRIKAVYVVPFENNEINRLPSIK